MKILLLTLSDNADHQDAVYSMFKALRIAENTELLLIDNPKINLEKNLKINTIEAPRRPGLTFQTFNIKQLLRLLLFIFKGDYDFVYIETLHIWNLLIWLCHPYRTKVIQVIHDVDPHPGDKSVKMVELMNRLACKFSDAIFLRSEDSIIRFKEKYNTAKNVEAIDLWRSDVDYMPLRHTHRALFFGRINKYKGIEYLCEITEKCKEVQFDIIGRAEDSIKSIIEELGKKPNVNICCDYISEEKKIEYFRDADFFILPYKSATQSGVVVDANRYSRPVIAFNVGGIRHQVYPGRNGVLVDSGAVNDFSVEVKKMASLSSIEMDRLSVSSYELFKEKYSAEVASNRFLELLRKLK